MRCFDLKMSTLSAKNVREHYLHACRFFRVLTAFRLFNSPLIKIRRLLSHGRSFVCFLTIKNADFSFYLKNADNHIAEINESEQI